MKQSFRDKLHLNKKNKELLETINEIIEEYSMEGYKLTLRQLYYQLVSRDIIPNEQKEYAKLSRLLTEGRMAGFVDWSAIEDRNRRPHILYSVDDIDDAIEDTINQYRLDRQEGQDVHVELWVEKDALSGVLKRVTEKYHIKLIVNKGYSSTSAMYDSYERFSEKISDGKKVVILYLGDHDPSGLDMIRDIRERSKEFIINANEIQKMYNEIDDVENLADELMDDYGHEEKFYVTDDDDDDGEYFDHSKAYACKLFDEKFEVKPIGLTMEQIKKFNPPPNPAKLKDPRGTGYIKKYGNVAWEVDALNPETLLELVKENVEELININLFNKQLKKEEKDKEKLREMLDK